MKCSKIITIGTILCFNFVNKLYVGFLNNINTYKTKFKNNFSVKLKSCQNRFKFNVITVRTMNNRNILKYTY